MIAQHSAHGQAPDPGLTVETDQDDLRCLDYLSLNFTHPEGTFIQVPVVESPQLIMWAQARQRFCVMQGSMACRKTLLSRLSPLSLVLVPYEL